MARTKLAEVDGPVERSADAEDSVILPATPPAKLDVSKQFKDYNGSEYDYDQVTGADKGITLYGPITYTISAENAFTIYQKEGENSFKVFAYEDEDGNTVQMTGQTSYTLDAHTDYYLLPDVEYSIYETLNADQQKAMKQTDNPATVTWTPVLNLNQGDSKSVVFHNTETVGSIKIHKKSDTGENLEGAVFTLFKADGTTQVSEKTTPSGDKITFERLPYGTYVVEEKTAPTGYAPGAVTRWTVTVSAETPNPEELVIENTKNSVKLKLVKYVGVAEGNNPTDISTKANASFAGTFTLEYFDTAANEWKTYSGNENFKVNSVGEKEITVKAYDDNNQPIKYRFVEAIPTGYYDAVSGATDKAYGPNAEGTTMITDGHAADKTVSMYNRQPFTIKLQKNFYDINTSGTTTIEKNKTVEISLATVLSRSNLSFWLFWSKKNNGIEPRLVYLRFDLSRVDSANQHEIIGVVSK